MAATTFSDVTGTPIVAAWLNDVNMFTYSIDAYTGVDPTGATDSATAINAALIAASAAGYKTVRFTGNYTCASELVLVSNMRYEITGTLTITSSEYGIRIPNSATNIVIEGFGLGKIQGTYSRNGTGLGAGVSNIRIYGMDISGATIIGAGYSCGFFIDGVNSLHVDRNYFHGNGRGAISGSQADNADFIVYTSDSTDVNIGDYNRFVSTAVSFNLVIYNANSFTIGSCECGNARGGASNNKGYGILLYAAAGAGKVKNGRVNKPYVHDTQGSGIYLADVQDTVIESPICYNIAQTQSDVSIPVGGVAINGGYRNKINNPMVDTSGSNGIVITTPAADAGLDTGNNVNGGRVRNCTKYGYYARGVTDYISFLDINATDCAINFYSDSGATTARYMKVTGQVSFSKTGTSGARFENVSNSYIDLISVKNAQWGLIVNSGDGNVIRGVYTDNSTDTANTYDGVVNSSTNTEINIKSKNTSSTGQRYGLWNVGNYCNIHDCDLTRNQTDGIRQDGSGVTRIGNKLSTSATPGSTDGGVTLSSGTVTVTTDEVRTGDNILLLCITAGGTQGIVRVGTITNATSFVITSSSASDSSSYLWKIIH